MSRYEIDCEYDSKCVCEQEFCEYDSKCVCEQEFKNEFVCKFES